MSRTLQKICRFDVELSLKYSSRAFQSRFLKQITSSDIICSLPSSIVMRCEANLSNKSLVLFAFCSFVLQTDLHLLQVTSFSELLFCLFACLLFVCLLVCQFFQINITLLSPNLSATMTVNLDTVLPFQVTYIHTYVLYSSQKGFSV